MPSIISAGTTANTGLNLTADTSGNLVFQTNGNTTAMTIDTSQNVTYANGVSFTGVIGGNGANISSMNASNLTSGTVANARTTASSSNGASTIVLRDSSGAFSAGVITANGSGLTGISASNISTGTLAAARLPTGSVLQVVSTTKTDTFSESVAGGGTSGDVSGLTASITPSATSNKVLITVSVSVAVSGSPQGSYLKLYRGGSVLSGAVGNTAGSRQSTTASSIITGNYVIQTMCFTYLDTPSSTSSLTYSVRFGHSSTVTRTVYVNLSEADTNSSDFARAASTITVMEIAG